MQKIDYSKIKSIHFVGIKGVGMTPLAIIAKEAGFHVTGSDIGDVFITDDALAKAEISPEVGFLPEHILNADLVITTGGHGGYDNPEVVSAKEKDIPVITQGEAVGLFMHGDLFQKAFFGISVAGCHGKTTTTAMIATMFDQANLNPSYVIGTSNIVPIGMPGHFGGGKYFIAEADEYATEPKYDHTPKFLWQHPQIAVITNIEHDHPDIYPTIDDTRKAYVRFAKSLTTHGKDLGFPPHPNPLPQGEGTAPGLLVIFGDDGENRKLLKEYSGEKITYGFSEDNDYVIRDVRVEEGQTVFAIEGKGVALGDFSLRVFGEHNAVNATAAIIVGLECGLSIPKIQQGLLAFKGTKRRFEIIKTIASGALLIDDYAHHPTEIKKTLRAAKDQFPKEKVICIFQPHTYSRTKLLFEDFSSSFINADEVILVTIYPSARELPNPSVSSELLAQAIKKFNKHVLSLPTIQDVVKYIKQKQFGKEYILITMGAGDVYKIAEGL